MGAQPGLNNEARNSERDLSQNCHHWSDQAGNYLSATGLPQKYLGRHRHLSGLIVTSRVPMILVNLRNCRSFGKQTRKCNYNRQNQGRGQYCALTQIQSQFLLRKKGVCSKKNFDKQLVGGHAKKSIKYFPKLWRFIVQINILKVASTGR